MHLVFGVVSVQEGPAAAGGGGGMIGTNGRGVRHGVGLKGLGRLRVRFKSFVLGARVI